MKIFWSAIHSLLFLTLASCGSEEFGTTPQSSTSKADPLRVFEQHSCTSHTLIRPKVDILYVVDNSGSSFDITSAVKESVKYTVNTISQDFDYRVIGTTLLNHRDDTTPHNDYRVMTNSNEDALPSEAQSRRVFNPNDLTFFAPPITIQATERGLGRTVEFMEHHRTTGLLRNGAYHLVVLVSNGRDDEVEYMDANGTMKNHANYGDRLQRFMALKTSLASQQLRFMSVSAKTTCSGSKSSALSYIKMASDLYEYANATDNNANRDSYDICSNGLSSLFSAVNNSIKQIVIPHTYRYWPVTFAQSTDTRNSFGEIQVYRIPKSGSPELMPSSSWTWEATPSGSRNIREPGQDIVNAYHFIRFNDLISYPDCIQVKSVSRTEYFGYIVLQREPRPETIYVTINGKVIPKSTTNGWEYKGNITRANIKVSHPDSPGSETPPISRSGFMIQLHGTDNYYKSGDNVQVNFIPAAI